MARVKNLENYEAVKKSIILAAIEMMVKHSVSKFNLTDVAKSVGMTKAALYWYFPSKEVLNSEVAELVYQIYVDRAKEIADNTLNPYEKLKMLILGNQDDMQAALMCAFPIKLFLEYYSAENYLKNIIQKGYEEYNNCISKILRAGITEGYFKTNIDIDYLAKFISGSIDGLALQNLISASNTAQVPRTVILSVIDGLLSVGGGQRIVGEVI